MTVATLATKVVLNKTFGGFQLSERAKRLILNLKGIAFFEYMNKWKDVCFVDRLVTTDTEAYEHECIDWNDIPRNDPELIRAVEQLGRLAGQSGSRLEVESIDLSVYIHDYDGMETLKWR